MSMEQCSMCHHAHESRFHAELHARDSSILHSLLWLHSQAATLQRRYDNLKLGKAPASTVCSLAKGLPLAGRLAYAQPTAEATAAASCREMDVIAAAVSTSPFEHWSESR